MRDITIAIIAASYHGNKGAAAMLQSSIHQLLARFGAALHINLMSVYPKADKKLLPFDFIRVVPSQPERVVFFAFPLAILYRLFRWLPPVRRLIARNKVIKAYTQTDLAIDEAGISFVDSRGFVMNLYAFITIAIPMLVGVPVVKYSQALGTFHAPANRWLAKRILPKVKIICARGEITRQNLADIGIAENVVLCADGAFSMPDDAAIDAEVAALCQGDAFYQDDVIGLSLSSVVEKKCTKMGIDYRAVMTQFVDTLTARGFSVLLLANAARLGSDKPRNNDLMVCDAVYAAAAEKERVRWYPEEMPPEKIRALIARCRLLVAARFHAMIGALEKGVPTLLVGWSHKYKEVLDMFELGDCAVDFSALDSDMLLQHFDAMLENENAIRAAIQSHLPAVLESSRQNIALFAQYIDEHVLPTTAAAAAPADDTGSDEAPTKKKKWTTWAGRLLMLVAFAFIIYSLVKNLVDFSILKSAPVVIGLCLLPFLHAVGIFWGSVTFSHILDMMASHPVDRSLVSRIYCRSNLYRYIPGNIMHYVGRNQIAVDAGIPHSEVVFSTIADAIFLLLSALIITVGCAFDYFFQYLAQLSISLPVVLAVVAGVVLVAAVLFVLRKKIGHLIKKYINIMRRIRFKKSLLFLVMVGMRLVNNAVVYLCTIALLGQPLKAALVPQIIGLFVMSWAIGFLTPGAPAGLGVREAVMLMFLGDVLDANVLMASTIIYRVICILGDIIALAYSKIYVSIRQRRLARKGALPGDTTSRT
ncbi:MAG: polysaccharide pyruvyl transferase family protein [Oscillospiraceae bacterium]